jgi:hypothetical protein
MPIDFKQLKNAPATGGDIALSKKAPTSNVTITAGYSGIVGRKYTIKAGVKLIIKAGASFHIQ